jgi:hypothetical protein
MTEGDGGTLQRPVSAGGPPIPRIRVRRPQPSRLLAVTMGEASVALLAVASDHLSDAP